MSDYYFETKTKVLQLYITIKKPVLKLLVNIYCLIKIVIIGGWPLEATPSWKGSYNFFFLVCVYLINLLWYSSELASMYKGQALNEDPLDIEPPIATLKVN